MTTNYRVFDRPVLSIRSLYFILVVRLSRFSCLYLYIPGWCRRGKGYGGRGCPDRGRPSWGTQTGTPAPGEVPRHGRLVFCPPGTTLH